MSQRTDTLKFILQEANDTMLAQVTRIGPDDWGKPVPPEGWTVRDVLTHLAANQPTQPMLIRNVLAGKGGARPDFDLNFYNKRGLEKRQDKSVAELLAELAAGHADTLKLLDEVSDEQLDTKGQHPSAGFVTTAEIFHVIAYHNFQHTGHMREALNR